MKTHTPVSEFSHRGQTVAKYHIWLNKIRTVILSSKTCSSSYSNEALLRRLTQKVIEDTFQAYCKLSQDDFLAEKFTRIEDFQDQNRKVKGLLLRGDGRIVLDLKLVLKNIGQFFLYLGFVYFQFWRNCFSGWINPKKLGRATLLTDIGTDNAVRNGDDSEFVRFCRTGPIIPLRRAHRIIVQSTADVHESAPDYVRFSRWPIFQLIRDNSPGIRFVFQFHLNIFKATLEYLTNTARFPLFSVLHRDYAFHPIIVSLNDQGWIENYFFTLTSVEVQYLWMSELGNRKFSSHMVWYAMNPRLQVYSQDPIEWTFPFNYYLSADEFWAWHESPKGWYSSLGLNVKLNFVGPILWYLPEKLQKEDTFTGFSVMVFDLTPTTREWSLARGFLGHYYEYENMRNYLAEILEIIEELWSEQTTPVRVLLKHKRNFASHHDLRYLDFVRGLEKQYKFLSIVPNNSNLYSLIDAADVVLSTPFTSPSYIAALRNKPGVFFDASGTLSADGIVEKNLHFINSKAELKIMFMELLKLSNFKRGRA